MTLVRSLLFSYLVCVFLVLSSVSLCAQIDYPMISEDNVWEIRIHCNEDVPSYQDLRVSYLKDSIIADDTVSIFSRDETLYGNFRSYYYELDKKVFMARESNSNYTDTSFMLVYDYNLMVGDTFYSEDQNAIGSRDRTILVVEEIDSVQMFMGEFRKRFNFEVLHDDDICVANYPYVWIDGIGGPGHPFLPEVNDCFECVFSVDCFTYQEERAFYDCVFNSVDETTVPDVIIYPNPVNNYFFIKTESAIEEVII